ncbi:catabolite repression HPr-like protein [Geomicrobium halophilum]|uniref:Catabolite repression HPr-like protein n=1 Tax=Geomicrobium halophilum TaxID=549000 RepID=A0A841PT06_9BACL|nr:HPr family phosphocarrier protein [Geomicrobium halophilum]MBB6450326.1 catabolite repression HPr-like protein [Geomicrobium halophilum]
MIEREVKVNLKTGLQARPAALFVQEANRYQADITVAKKGQKEANAKSIMGVMSLAIRTGDVLNLSAEGGDKEEAMEALVNYVSQE